MCEVRGGENRWAGNLIGLDFGAMMGDASRW